MDPKERTKGTHKGLHCHLVAPKGITLEVVCEMFVFKYLLILASGPFQNALSYFFCGPGRDGHVTTPCVHVFTPLKMMKLSERVGSPSWSPRILILTLPSASGVLHCTAICVASTSQATWCKHRFKPEDFDRSSQSYHSPMINAAGKTKI